MDDKRNVKNPILTSILFISLLVGYRKIQYYLLGKGAGIHPLLLQDGPEVFGQAAQHIIVGKPAIAAISPGSAPGVAEEEGAICFLLVEFIGDFHFIVTGLKHHRIAAIKRLAEQESRCGRLFSSQRQQR